MAKSYFAVLGISPNATGGEVKSAYRRLAKEFHPDRCPGGDERFCQIQEAYSVLGDSRRRREYEKSIRRTRPTGPLQASRRPGPEPLMARGRGRAPETLVPGRSPDPFTSGIDEIAGRRRTGFPAPPRPQSGPVKKLLAEISLTPAQARRGGSARIAVPVRAVCPACGGYGGSFLFECPRCGGSGSVAAEIPLPVTFPAGLSRNYDVTIPLDRFGIRNVLLTVTFRPPGRQ